MCNMKFQLHFYSAYKNVIFAILVYLKLWFYFNRSFGEKPCASSYLAGTLLKLQIAILKQEV